MRTRRLHLAARRGAAVLAAGLLLAGCGGGGGNGVADLEPREIIDRAREAAQAQESVSVSGSVQQEGETVSLDLLLTQGGSASGTVAVADTEVRLVAAGADLFIGADLFAAQGVEVPEGVEFVQVPRDATGFEDVSSLVDLPSFFDELLTPEGELTKEDGPDVDGTPTVAVISDAAPSGRLLVATEGEPLPLRIEGAEEGQDQAISFDFGVPVDVAPPAPEVVASVEQLVGEQPSGEPAPQEQPRAGEAAAQAEAQAQAEREAAEEAAAQAEAQALAEREAAEEAAAQAAAEEAAAETSGQKNARGAAENYLSTSGFSRSGLIKQLEFEGYSTQDATYGVDSVNADWNRQAARSAQAYLDISPFSRSGLIEQLIFEGYTREQAEYGVTQAGL